jgi:hypothetical protein
MSVYKEGFALIQQISLRSARIYKDAADFGAPTIKGDIVWNSVKQLVADYGDKDTYRKNEYETGSDVYCQVVLRLEFGPRKGEEIRYHVSYVTTKNGNLSRDMDGYVTVSQIPLKPLVDPLLPDPDMDPAGGYGLHSHI